METNRFMRQRKEAGSLQREEEENTPGSLVQTRDALDQLSDAVQVDAR